METEIKLAPVLPHQAALVLADARVAPCLSAPRKIRIRSEYYDTSSGALAARGFALRLRSEDEKRVCTLKGPSPLPDTRLELEPPAESISEGVAALLLLPEMPAEAAEILRAGALEKTCAASFTRMAYIYKKDGLTLELCVDEGQTEKDGLIGSICEIELELVSGEYADLKKLAESICAAHGLSQSRIGKRAQAMALGEGGAGRAVNPFFVGAEMLNYCVRCKYIELRFGEDRQLRYILTPLGEREMPRLFGVSFDKPCAFTGGDE